jgi:hypothetical protein
MYLHTDERLSGAWAPWFTHEYLLYPVITHLKWLMELPSIEIKSNPDFCDWEIGPNHQDIYKENAIQTRTLNTMEIADCALRNADYSLTVPTEVRIAPWIILLLYSTEPDLLLDCDLNLHWSQKLTKGSHGYRHMQFRLFGKTFGASQRSFQYYWRAFQKSVDLGNIYWAWRFLSRASHYLADLGHPYHVKVIPYRYLLKNLRHPKKMLHTLAAMHNSHEVYVQYRFRQGFTPFNDALQQGLMRASINNSSFILWRELKKYRKRSENRLSSLFLIQEQFGSELFTAYDLIHDHPDMDLSKSTLLAEQAAQEIMFRPENSGLLEQLDEITIACLEDVGFMLGLLFRAAGKYLKII